ncbi:MAG: ATP-binding cassette domain-containing protein [Pseudomonadota bacterium]
MGEALVQINSVTKSFIKGHPPALNAISAQVEAGKITGLVGPDGAGKTTLIRLITGLLVPDEGKITALGCDTRSEARSIHAAVGYMPQRFGLYEDLTVQENLSLYANLRGLSFQQRAGVFERLLDFTDLARFTDRLSGQLSGGMKQKLGLACALIKTPKLLLLDEPSVGVDPISRRELWRMVQDLTSEGIGVVWSTAYLDEAERCDDVILLNEGELLFQGPPNGMTGRAAGRVDQIVEIKGRRRAVLANALDIDGVVDGVIQGRAVRVVYRRDDVAATRLRATEMVAATEPTASVVQTEPRFEDAFIDALGGGPGGRSTLAAHTVDIAVKSNSGNQDSSDGDKVIVAKGLTKRFGDFVAARDVTFAIPRGEIFGLLGPNGAGKSTSFKMLCGLLKPTAGEGTVAGFDLRRAAAEARNRLGYMAQKFSLYGDLSVAQNLEFFAGAYGLSRKRRRERIDTMIETFDLPRFLATNAKDLPLGYKQRLALACAVMHEPEALFLDEPTSGVDPITRREFWTHINGLVERGVAVLVTTHFMDEAEYCDRIALIYRSRTIATGSPDALKAQVTSLSLPDPSLEDAFIRLVEDSESGQEAA